MDDEMFHPQAPPSYALESDSDGDSDIEGAVKPREPKRPKPESVVEVRGETKKGMHVVFFVGEAGEVLAKGVKVGDASAVVLVDGEQLASVHLVSSTTTLVLASTALPLVSLYLFASTLLSTLSPTSTTVVSSYNLPSYVAEKPFEAPPVLFLSSAPKPTAIASLEHAGHLSPYTPPNLLHGLAPLLLTLSTLTGNEAELILLPSITPPAPLNGPFPASSSWSNTIYDAGGPTSLSDSRGVYGEVRRPLMAVATELGWTDWWDAKRGDGKAFDWVEKQRRVKRREQQGSMYM